MVKIGITEMNDPALDDRWRRWVNKGEPAILITKNIKKLCTENIGLLNQNIIIHATCTGYGGTVFEPGVPAPQEILDFLATIKKKENIVIRIDPIIPLNALVSQSKKIYNACKDLGYERFRISILDMYVHTWKRMTKVLNHITLHDLEQVYDPPHSVTGTELSKPHAQYALRKKIIDYFPGSEVCGEPGFPCDGCISFKDLKLLKIHSNRVPKGENRPFCSCLGVKKELLMGGNEACQHACIYCYMKRNGDPT
jgi:DNA repair photolyase